MTAKGLATGKCFAPRVISDRTVAATLCWIDRRGLPGVVVLVPFTHQRSRELMGIAEKAERIWQSNVKPQSQQAKSRKQWSKSKSRHVDRFMALPRFTSLHCVSQLQDHLLQICILVLRALSEEPSIAWGEDRVAFSFWRTNWLKIHVADMRHSLIKRDQGVTTLETWGAAWGFRNEVRLLSELSSCTSFAASQHFATWCQETALELKLVKRNICQMLPPLLSRQHEDLWPCTCQAFLKHSESCWFCAPLSQKSNVTGRFQKRAEWNSLE